jgi:hypothetical protein
MTLPRSGGRPPVDGPPTRFTDKRTFTGAPRWLVHEDHDAGEVAAAFAQQQVIANIRKRRGLNVSAAEVADHLGRPRTDRTVIEFWSGRRAISLPMLLSLALAFDVNPLAHCDPDDLSTLLPEEHRSWLGSWRPGIGRPAFRSPIAPGGEPAWQRAARQLASWITNESESETLHLTTDAVATHAAAAALISAGLPAELASMVVGPHSRQTLRYEASPEIDLQVKLQHDDNGPSRMRQLGTIRQLWELRRAAAHRAVAILILGHRERARFEQLLPGFGETATGDTVRVPPSALKDAGIPSADASQSEFELVRAAYESTLNGYTTIIFELVKPT